MQAFTCRNISDCGHAEHSAGLWTFRHAWARGDAEAPTCAHVPKPTDVDQILIVVLELLQEALELHLDGPLGVFLRQEGPHRPAALILRPQQWILCSAASHDFKGPDGPHLSPMAMLSLLRMSICKGMTFERRCSGRLTKLQPSCRCLSLGDAVLSGRPHDAWDRMHVSLAQSTLLEPCLGGRIRN